MNLEYLGVSAAKRRQFGKREIFNVEDLLSYLPRKYNDYSTITGILPSDQVSCIKARVVSTSSRNAGKIPYVSAQCEELQSGASVQVTWFRCPWIYQQIREYVKKDIVIAGKITYNEQFGYSIVQPEIFDYAGKCLGVYPIYKAIPGMSAEYLRAKIELALDTDAADREMLPEDILIREGELPMKTTFRYIHAPKCMEECAEGTKRVILNDLLYFALHNELNKNEFSLGSQYRIKTLYLLKRIEKDLPYKLTDDQNKAIEDMVESARKGMRIQSFVQGDVGSGKTVIAALIAAAFLGSGYQVVMMAPTQVLAKQHFDSMMNLFSPYEISVMYLDSSLKAKERREVLKNIASGEAELIIGTHACIGKDVVFHDLALTIVDEEHRFGVQQRAAIIKKANGGAHSITMSATPIPRSLAQVMYGDHVQLHTIKTLPSGRKPVVTGIAQDKQRVFRFLLSEIRKGHQVYVVCPMIESCDKDPNINSVDSVASEYATVFANQGVRIETLTGKDDAAKTGDTLKRFKDGTIDILIATTVIEVGVNVPNATVIVINNADRFGLSGLHQLRGRVGRGDKQSYCILQTDSKDEKALSRLAVMCKTNDGFQIAEEDMKLRGAGDLLGTQQSGVNRYVKMMLENPDIYKTAVRLAKELIDRGMDCCSLTRKVEEERNHD